MLKIFKVRKKIQAIMADIAAAKASARKIEDNLPCLLKIDADNQLLQAKLETYQQQVKGLHQEIQALRQREDEYHYRTTNILRAIADNEVENRRQLRAIRQSVDYEKPFTMVNPLVSVIIPTYTNTKLLLERAIPSVLNQTYQNFEVVIVGDGAPANVASSIEEIGDSRITYHNLKNRVIYPEDRDTFWKVAGIPAWNEALQHIQGLWICPHNDDDAFCPDHIEVLLEEAQKTKTEIVYGKIDSIAPDGSRVSLGKFLPSTGNFGWQAAILHHGLSFIEKALVDGLFGDPGDWSFCRRLIQAGASIRMIDRTVTDYYPSMLWSDRANEVQQNI
jgi:hypothetical protein